MRLSGLFLLAGLAIAETGPTLVIRDVSIIDVATGAVEPHRTVIVRGERIASIGPAAKAKVPPRAQIVQAAGKYLIPGLWDMHVHLWNKYHQFPLYIANGITGVRDMGSNLGQVNEWLSQIMRGQLVGPRIVTCGPPVEGVGGPSDPKLPTIMVATPEEARRAFDTLEHLNVNFIKVLSNLSRESYIALTQRCRQWRIQFAGHLPESVSALEAADSRQSSIEHLFGLLLACSSEERELRARRIEAYEKSDRETLRNTQARILETYDPAKAAALFDKLRRFDIRQTPTLVMLRRKASIGTSEASKNPRLKYVDQSIRKEWRDPAPLEAARALVLRKEYDRLLLLVRDMNRAGVPMLAGTDTGDPFAIPGFELHEELALLVKAGLTEIQALRSATLEPARMLRKEDSMGTVKPKKFADLVLLDANPLADIRNTQKIAGVVAGGKYLSKSALTALLADIASRAKTH